MTRPEDDEDRVLKDGERVSFSIMMMDAASAERAAEDARAAMVAELSEQPAIERGTRAAPSADPYAQMIDDMNRRPNR